MLNKLNIMPSSLKMHTEKYTVLVLAVAVHAVEKWVEGKLHKDFLHF